MIFHILILFYSALILHNVSKLYTFSTFIRKRKKEERKKGKKKRTKQKGLRDSWVTFVTNYIYIYIYPWGETFELYMYKL